MTDEQAEQADEQTEQTEQDAQSGQDTQSGRSIDLSIQVPGSPEEVWQAIATGPGISSWYVPTTIVEEGGQIGSLEGAEITQDFGPGMAAQGVITAWQPPHRFAFGAPDGSGLAFEWLVEARDGGSCVVRLVNSGFGTGEPWDDQYDAMTEGWAIFLANLRLHLLHFGGRAASASLPMAMWQVEQSEAWRVLLDAAGLGPEPVAGDVAISADGVPTLRGTVVDAVAPHHLTLLLTEPAEGTALLAAEGMGGMVGVSTWLYLYGADAAATVAREGERWTAWLAERATG